MTVSRARIPVLADLAASPSGEYVLVRYLTDGPGIKAGMYRLEELRRD